MWISGSIAARNKIPAVTHIFGDDELNGAIVNSVLCNAAQWKSEIRDGGRKTGNSYTSAF